MLWQKYKNDILEYCGKDVLVKHLKDCGYLYKQLNDRKKQRMVLKEILQLDFNIKCILQYILTYSSAFMPKR